jgi:GNAT superfamily N-acetyltransferase
MGPYLARREIIKALDEPLYDDDGKVWYVAVSKADNNKVLGFASVMPTKGGKKVIFDNAYVLPDYRNNGIFHMLVQQRLQDYQNVEITLIANGRSAVLYESFGFRVYRETKNYKFMTSVAVQEVPVGSTTKSH